MSSKLGLDRMIPRFAHTDLGMLLVKYLIYIRTTEELFARYLWGMSAYRVVHTYMFWRSKGLRFDEGDEFTPILKAATAKYLGAGLNVHKWRHLAAALGRLFLIIIEGNEDTNMMDAAAGRTTTTSERIYALQPGDLGRLNIHTMSKFRAMSNIWQNKAFHLVFNNGHLPTVDEVLQPGANIRPDGLTKQLTQNNPTPLDHAAIQRIVSQVLDDHMGLLLPRIESTIASAIQKGLHAHSTTHPPPAQGNFEPDDPNDDLWLPAVSFRCQILHWNHIGLTCINPPRLPLPNKGFQPQAGYPLSLLHLHLHLLQCSAQHQLHSLINCPCHLPHHTHPPDSPRHHFERSPLCSHKQLMPDLFNG